MSVASPALAQQDGPFASTAALASYWSTQSTGGSLTQIYVNGTLAYQRSGFGPAFVKEYFNCADGSGIKAFCNNIFDGYLRTSDAMGTFSSGLTVYLDGTLIRSGDPYYSAHLKTCLGDMSYYGRVKYYIVESVNDGFGPPYPGNDCF
ncbi:MULTISPECIES: hypothetical protein [Myxococcus]|uniref:Uncharacterized protein n=1 Tax=Myxococcus llanfairpwllgwyngyllgogerychwyrndrobwllllantysiliogogogochensis TaxID=2590453 RepID=A0A540WIJ0_9BACT|nr:MULTISPECIES: hypothetical protein [Myxococcus]NTX00829.1 hypothetical protein [Myxococcus sp. CA040A]NTX33484.1 hypothetical protein [Myxococcus sp. CA033]TQF08829.1 hypothetical protein FJV41_47820 [Myxococcus llanfairpwllgwyngyllgogerychwyrndrobwllllantysiliogogogochensis]